MVIWKFAQRRVVLTALEAWKYQVMIWKKVQTEMFTDVKYRLLDELYKSLRWLHEKRAFMLSRLCFS